MLPTQFVSIPFSSGRAFAPSSLRASSRRHLNVSIPFSSGRAFAPKTASSSRPSSRRFNPLLIGACIRTTKLFKGLEVGEQFQSPSHRGVHSHNIPEQLLSAFSGNKFQSPSHRGVHSHCRICWVSAGGSESFNPLLIGACIRTLKIAWAKECGFKVSIPFSSGRAFAPILNPR